MEVFQHEERRPRRGDGLEQLGHRVEQPDDVLHASRRAGRPEVREETTELALESVGQEVSRLRQTAALSDRVDPRSERQYLLGLVRASSEHAPAIDGRGGELGDQPALADPGLAGEHDGLAASRAGRLPGLVEPRPLGLAPYQRRIGNQVREGSAGGAGTPADLDGRRGGPGRLDAKQGLV